MKIGLGTLDKLKKHLLPKKAQADPDFDEPLSALGRAVAAQFERIADRQFQRAEGATASFWARRTMYVLPRYPVESIDLVEIRAGHSGAEWTAIPDAVASIDEESGLVHFTRNLGGPAARARVTWTGGYWIDDGETEMPAGATALPDDLYWAWLRQCAAVWQRMHKLGIPLESRDPKGAEMGESAYAIALLPEVAETLQGYRRWQLS